MLIQNLHNPFKILSAPGCIKAYGYLVFFGVDAVDGELAFVRRGRDRQETMYTEGLCPAVFPGGHMVGKRGENSFSLHGAFLPGYESQEQKSGDGKKKTS